MATLTFNGESFTVDHAAKGADYIHGYDADGVVIVSFDGITDFSGFSYSGTYMNPSDCLAEKCNGAAYCGGVLKTRGGASIPASAIGLGNVNNTSDANKPVSTAQATAIADAKAAGTTAQTNLTNHINNKSNPHGVTYDQTGAAAASHTHVFSSEITGTVSAGRGGTGRSSLTSGSYLVGNGSSAVTLRKAADVCADIGAASYEEGTWTPTDVNSCGLSFSTSTNFYTKIGRSVNVILKLKTASSTKSKAIKIGGLPFTPNATYGSPVGEWADCYNGTVNAVGIVACIGSNDSYNIVLKNHSNAEVKDSDLGASHDMTISLYYQVKP